MVFQHKMLRYSHNEVTSGSSDMTTKLNLFKNRLKQKLYFGFNPFRKAHVQLHFKVSVFPVCSLQRLSLVQTEDFREKDK